MVILTAELPTLKTIRGMAMISKDFNFENAIKELEKIANELESEQISLDKSIALFEDGVKLSRECSEYLETAKQKIISLTQAEEENEND